MTRAEFDAACRYVQRVGISRPMLIAGQELRFRPRRHSTSDITVAFWLSGKRISRAQAEALIEGEPHA